MAYVLTVDQIKSQRRPDQVAAALHQLRGISTVLPFTRTVGDEFQGMLDDSLSVTTAILGLMRTQQWHIGLGIGPVDRPLPADSRSARGPAFVAARTAVDEAKRATSHVRIVSSLPNDADAHDAEVVLRLISLLRERRSPQGWEAIDLMAAGHTQAETALRLDISRQAVGQRLQAAQWATESDAVPVMARLLARADAMTVGQERG